MDKLLVTGVVVGAGLIGYKAAIYATAAYQLKKEKQKKVVNLGTFSEYKEKLEKEKAQ